MKYGTLVFNIWVLLDIKVCEDVGYYWLPIRTLFELLGALSEPVESDNG